VGQTFSAHKSKSQKIKLHPSTPSRPLLKEGRLIPSTIFTTTNRSNGSPTCHLPSPEPVSLTRQLFSTYRNTPEQREVNSFGSYNTTSNRTRIIKTPGGETRVLHIKKRGTAPKCGDCGIKLPGVSLFSLWALGGGQREVVGDADGDDGQQLERTMDECTNANLPTRQATSYGGRPDETHPVTSRTHCPPAARHYQAAASSTSAITPTAAIEPLQSGV
jgi:ribosomal protein L34E